MDNPDKKSSNGIYKLNDVNSYILKGAWPNSFYDDKNPVSISSNFYTEDTTTFSNIESITGVLS
jgi:hypothetical protein